jgi:hypothetical protein
MFTTIANMLSGRKNRSTKPATRPFRPGLETLDAREVPSAASGGLHAVAPTPGVTHDADYFYIDNVTGLLKEGQLTLNGGAGTPSGIQTLSAGHDALGRPDVFVKAGDNSFWEFQEGKWTRLRGSNVVKTYAAVDGGRAYAVLFDNTLQKYDGHTWTRVPGSLLSSTSKVEAVTDKSGRDSVFAQALNGDLWEYDQLLPGSSVYLSNQLTRGFFNRVLDYSAGTDALGNAEVYASFRNALGQRSLQKNNHGSLFGWQFVMNGSGFKSFSATDSGAAWIAAPSGAVYEVDQFAHPGNLLGPAAAASYVSAASSTDVYFVSNDHTISEWVLDPLIGAFTENVHIGSSRF